MSSTLSSKRLERVADAQAQDISATEVAPRRYTAALPPSSLRMLSRGCCCNDEQCHHEFPIHRLLPWRISDASLNQNSPRPPLAFGTGCDFKNSEPWEGLVDRDQRTAAVDDGTFALQTCPFRRHATVEAR